MTLLIFYASISIFFSFLCSILEAVFLSVTPTFISVKKKEGMAFANTLERLKQDIDKPLIAILTLNTLAHTVGAILVGVQSEVAFGTGNYMVGIVSAIMTFLILIVSEIIPKTIGATYWKKLANFTSKLLTIIIFPLKWTGLLWLLQVATKLIGKGKHRSALSREDFFAMTDIATEKGVFKESESKVIKNLLRFKNILAEDIMTPRSVMQITSENQTVENFYKFNKELLFSRIPVYLHSPNDITGYILKDDLLENLANDKHDKILSEFKREILIVNQNISVPDLFEKFIELKEHVALIVDKFGSVLGLVTMEDVIETLLGLEIIDEQDTHNNMQELARQKWKKRAKKYGLISE